MPALSAHHARIVVLAALVIGELSDAVIHDSSEVGLNLALIIIAVAMISAFVLPKPSDSRLADRLPLLVAGLCGLTIALRDAEALVPLNVLGAGAALALPLLRLRGVAPARVRPEDLVGVGFDAAGNLAAGAPRAIGEMGWRPPARATRHATPVFAGLVLAVPAVLLFGALFVEADPVFARVTRSILFFEVDPGAMVSHGLVIAVFFWLAAGYFRASLLPAPQASPVPAISLQVFGTGAAAGVVTLLGAVVLVFLLFVVVQARVMFGGDELIRATTGLTYAEYARRGFFQLLAASALVLPLVWLTAGLREAGSRGTLKALRMLEVAQAVLVALVMASAIWRMWLYVDAYGLTEDRLYGTAAITWLGLVLAWFGVTVLRGRPDRFAAGAIVAGYTVLLSLNAANPDAVIARVNVSRAVEGRPFDAEYAWSLSADAVPTLTRFLPQLNEESRCIAGRAIETWREPDPDWRTWNLGRARAGRSARQLQSGRFTGQGCPEQN